MRKLPRTFAFYLPQFHPCPENDRFWGTGFTDWWTTRNATPLFFGHSQPNVPAQLGYYDLRQIDVMRQQAALAKEHLVSGFAVYLYWFGDGKYALREPIENLHREKEVEIEYFLCWANGDWTKSWVGQDSIKIFQQKYNVDEYPGFFIDLISHFCDNRYLKVKNSPVFYTHAPSSFDFATFKSIGDKVARERGFDGICWIAPLRHTSPKDYGLLDYVVGYPPGDMNMTTGRSKMFGSMLSPLALLRKIARKMEIRNSTAFRILNTFDYSEYAKRYNEFMRGKSQERVNYIPCSIPNWDNTPRYSGRGFVLRDAVPEVFQGMHETALKIGESNCLPIVLTKAWNEWAEGNYLEPDEQRGTSLLTAIKRSYSQVSG